MPAGTTNPPTAQLPLWRMTGERDQTAKALNHKTRIKRMPIDRSAEIPCYLPSRPSPPPHPSLADNARPRPHASLQAPHSCLPTCSLCRPFPHACMPSCLSAGPTLMPAHLLSLQAPPSCLHALMPLCRPHPHACPPALSAGPTLMPACPHASLQAPPSCLPSCLSGPSSSLSVPTLTPTHLHSLWALHHWASRPYPLPPLPPQACCAHRKHT